VGQLKEADGRLGVLRPAIFGREGRLGRCRGLARAGALAFALGCIEGSAAHLALLALLEAIHQDGVIGRFDLGPGLGIVPHLGQALLLGGLHGIKSGIHTDPEPFVGAGLGAGGGGIRALVHAADARDSDPQSVGRTPAGATTCKRSEQGIAGLETLLLQKHVTLALRLVQLQAAASLDQGHLRGQVTALEHLHLRETANEVHVIPSPISPGANQPERTRHQALRL